MNEKEFAAKLKPWLERGAAASRGDAGHPPQVRAAAGHGRLPGAGAPARAGHRERRHRPDAALLGRSSARCCSCRCWPCSRCSRVQSLADDADLGELDAQLLTQELPPGRLPRPGIPLVARQAAGLIAAALRSRSRRGSPPRDARARSRRRRPRGRALAPEERRVLAPGRSRTGTRMPGYQQQRLNRPARKYPTMQPIQKERFEQRIRDWADDDARAAQAPRARPSRACASSRPRSSTSCASAGCSSTSAPAARARRSAARTAHSPPQPQRGDARRRCAPRRSRRRLASARLRAADRRWRWSSSPPSRSSPSFGDATHGWRRHLLQAWVLAVCGAYFVWFWTRGGQTLPMKTWRIRLVRDDGAPLGAGARAAPLPARGARPRSRSAWASLWALVDRDRQFLHDRLAGTALIDRRQRTSARARSAQPPRPATTIATGIPAESERRPVVEQAHVREEPPGEVEAQADEDAEHDLRAHAARARASRARTGSRAPSSPSPPADRAACSRTRSRSASPSAGCRAGARCRRAGSAPTCARGRSSAPRGCRA